MAVQLPPEFWPDSINDFTPSGPEGEHAAFWKCLRGKVDLGEETDLERVLKRHHDDVVLDGQECLAFSIQDYTLQACNSCEYLSGSKPLKYKVLMKCLWLGRLACPDIVKPIGDLATQFQKWSTQLR